MSPIDTREIRFAVLSYSLPGIPQGTAIRMLPTSSAWSYDDISIRLMREMPHVALRSFITIELVLADIKQDVYMLIQREDDCLEILASILQSSLKAFTDQFVTTTASGLEWDKTDLRTLEFQILNIAATEDTSTNGLVVEVSEGISIAEDQKFWGNTDVASVVSVVGHIRLEIPENKIRDDIQELLDQPDQAGEPEALEKHIQAAALEIAKALFRS